MKLPYGAQTEAAMKAGAPGALEHALAALAVTWMSVDGLHPKVVRFLGMAQLGPLPHAACALDLCRALNHSPSGRKALRDFGFEGLFDHVEGE